MSKVIWQVRAISRTRKFKVFNSSASLISRVLAQPASFIQRDFDSFAQGASARQPRAHTLLPRTVPSIQPYPLSQGQRYSPGAVLPLPYGQTHYQSSIGKHSILESSISSSKPAEISPRRQSSLQARQTSVSRALSVL